MVEYQNRNFSLEFWQWTIAPEAEVAISVERDLGILLNGKYNYSFTGESVFSSDVNNSFWQVNVGVIWQPYLIIKY